MQTQTALTAIQTEGLATGQGVGRWFPASKELDWMWAAKTGAGRVKRPVSSSVPPTRI